MHEDRSIGPLKKANDRFRLIVVPIDLLLYGLIVTLDNRDCFVVEDNKAAAVLLPILGDTLNAVLIQQ